MEHACAWHLPPDPRIAQRSRALTRSALFGMEVTAEDIDAAELGVCELATNAFQHAQPPYGLRIWCAGPIAMVEVFDSTAHLPALPCTHSPDDNTTGTELDLLQEHGRGLALVSHLSQGRCGADRLSSGKLTWFSVARDGVHQPHSSPDLFAFAPTYTQLAITPAL